jgi:protein-S-isoprenylcysteine O-methyltransferase Ste14
MRWHHALKNNRRRWNCATIRCPLRRRSGTGLLAIQEGHRLQTGGFYRHVRYPSYAGLLLYVAGYVLVFGCWLGLLLVAGTLAVLLAQIKAEEVLLESELGDEYPSYGRRTWRLVPCVY